MARFVILRHDPAAGSTRPLHWDLMLEQPETLWTWALSEHPAAGRQIAAEHLADHRKLYLEFEGPLSGDRGIVSRWDQGDFSWVEQTTNTLVVRLSGQRLRGTVRLERSDVSDQRWTVTFTSDTGEEF